MVGKTEFQPMINWNLNYMIYSTCFQQNKSKLLKKVTTNW